MRRRTIGGVGAWVVAACGLLAIPAQAQQRQQAPGLPLPRVSVIAPSGGRAGAEVEIVVTGTDLDEPQGLLFSQPGLEAKALGSVEPPAKGQNNRRRGMQGQGGPVVSQKFRVTIPRDTPPGLLDVRLLNKWGVSNPRAFVVGDLPETAEIEPNNDVGEAQRLALNSTVHGAIGNPTDVDDFVFAGKKGQRVLVSGLASSIDSRLLLALELYDTSGKKLAANHEYQGTDALLDVTLPGDGDYLIRAFGFTYTRGDPEYVYRLSVTTAPWIDAVWPPVVEAGKTAQVTVYGRNLPGGQADPSATLDGRVLEKVNATVTAPGDPSALAYRGALPSIAAYVDGFEFHLRNDAGASNPSLLMTAEAPVVLDRGGNDTVETAQVVTPPCTIAGRIEALRDLDWYAFQAKKGDVLAIEVVGERLGAPLDLFFAVRDAQAKQMIGEFDEENPNNRNNQNPPALFTQTDDPPRHRFVAPSDGRYELLVTSREAANQAGPRHLYTVTIAPEAPDFRLVVMPASAQFPEACVVGQGGQGEMTVFVARRDGFNGALTLSADDLPKGVTCPPQVVGTGMKQGVLVFRASADAPDWAGTVVIKGAATVQGKKIVREARAATISWPVPPQQNIIPVSRLDLDRGCVLAVRPTAPFSLTTDGKELKATHGDKLTIPLTLARIWPGQKGPLQSVTLVNVPPALSNGIGMALSDDGGKATLTINQNVPPGVYALVFQGQAQVPFSKDPDAKQKPNVTVVQPSTPVVLTVVPKELAKVTVTPNNPSAQPGKTVELTVRVNRLFDFAGEFRVRLDLPPGLEADEATIPAGQNEAKLVVRVTPQAEPGNKANLTARLTASYEENATTTQEAKFSLNVTK